jgi:hypothetical protein
MLKVEVSFLASGIFLLRPDEQRSSTQPNDWSSRGSYQEA